MRGVILLSEKNDIPPKKKKKTVKVTTWRFLRTLTSNVLGPREIGYIYSWGTASRDGSVSV